MVTTEKTAFDNPVRAISTSGVLRYAVSLEDLLNGLLSGGEAFARMQFATPTEMTLNGSGLLAAPAQTQITVAANSGTADDLDSITAANETFVVLRAKTGHSITIRPGVGNIASWSGAGMVLTGYRMALLHCQGGTWALLNAPAPKHASATSDPGSGDDALDGYSNGSLWVNTTLDRAWICVDATVGGAVWQPVGLWKHDFSIRASAATAVAFGTRSETSGTLANANDSTDTWLSLTPAAATDGASAHVAEQIDLAAAGYFRLVHNPVIEILFKTGSDITAQRIWSGAVVVNSTPGDSSTLAVEFAGFRYDTEAGDTGWRPVLCDNTNQTVGAAIGTVQADTVYKFKIRVDSANTRAYFSVNDGAETLVSANFPSASVGMRGCTILYQTAPSNRTWLFSSLKVRW